MSHALLFRLNLRAALLFGAASAATVAGSSAVWAQQASSGQQIETVVVTGTMIHRQDYDTPSPVQVIDASQIKALGYTSTADLLQSIPDNNSGAVTSSFTGALAFGASGVSLRGLLEDSTLILIDGHRTSDYPIPSDGERSFTDLNTIPLDAIAQVQVLEDGASSSYGADAIGGVVNIILKHDFQGIEASAEGGTSQQGGGTMTHEAATFGVGDLSTDHFNFYIDGEYEYDQAIKVGQRGFPFDTNDLSSIGGLNNIGGQPQLDSGSIYGSVAPTMEMTAGNILSGGSATGLTQVLAPGGCGSLGKFTTTPGVGSYCTQNMELYFDDQPQTTRDGLYSRMTIEPNAHSEIYLDVSYFHYEDMFTGDPIGPGLAQIQAGSPTNTDSIVLPARLTGLGGPGTGPLNPNDPYANSPSCVEAVSCTDALINYAFPDVPFTAVSNNNVRSTLEATGQYWGWSYDGALTVAHSWAIVDIHGALNFPQLETDINDGAYNFLYPSKTSPAVLHALTPTMSNDSTSNDNSLDFSATRPIFDLPGGSAQLGLGGQYRTEDMNSPSFNGNLQGQSYPDSYASGSRRIVSAFGELDMPILTTFEADLSGRFDHYSDFGNTANPKLGLKWTPIPEVTFRGTASTGFKAPGFAENGNSQSAGFVTTTGATYSPAWAAEHCPNPPNGCTGDGYTNNSYALEEISTSFAGIKPETSHNLTGGMVVKPFDNVTASLDYYYIQKFDAIQFPNPTYAIESYLAGLPLPPGYSVVPDAPDPAYPNLIARPVVVSAPYVNSGSIITDGLDMSVTATFALTDTLNYTTQFNGSHIFEYSSIIPGQPRLEYAGTESPCEYTSCEGTPRDRFTWSNTLEFAPYSVTGTLLYVSGEKNIESDFAGPGGTVYPFPSGGAFWDFNLHASYDINEQMQVYGNMLNVFNTSPPVEPAQYGGVNYNPAAYQAGIVGRFFQLGVRYKTN